MKKRILATLLASAMVMGMTMGVSAETHDSAEINVTNAENATFKYLQVIEPDTKTDTGWAFTSVAIATDYKTAFGIEDDTTTDLDEQTAIAMLIRSDASLVLPNNAPSIIENATGATAAQVSQALDNVINGETFTDMVNPQTVTEAGVYAIKALETGFTYRAMAAYVGFGAPEVDDTEYEYPSLVCKPLTAKKISTDITKADSDDNDAVAIGDPISYTVKTSFPYFNQNDNNREFKIWDKLIGAEYTGLTEDESTEEIEKTAKVTIGGEEVEATFVMNGEGEDYGFVVNLSSFVDNTNSNAGKEVVITYDAVITEVETENTVGSRIGGVEVDSASTDVFTGNLTLTKVDADDNTIKLEGAGFEVSLNGETLKFEQKDASKKVYTYAPEDGTITEVFTDANGNVVVEGLDIGTYKFTEKTAPKGYSINEDGVEIVLDITDEGEAKDDVAVKVFADAGSIADTKLLALPSTGGIGTTIFTVAGCAIMIAAVVLLLANRRKETK